MEMARLQGVPPNISVSSTTPSPVSHRPIQASISARRFSMSSSGPIQTVSTFRCDADHVLHGGAQLIREPPVRHQDHADHARTEVSRRWPDEQVRDQCDVTICCIRPPTPEPTRLAHPCLSPFRPGAQPGGPSETRPPHRPAQAPDGSHRRAMEPPPSPPASRGRGPRGEMIRQFFNQMDGSVSAARTPDRDRRVFFALLHKSRQDKSNQIRDA